MRYAHVSREGASLVTLSRLPRKCACGGTPGPTGECEECRRKRLQRKERKTDVGTGCDSALPPIIDEVLRSPGQPFDSRTRTFFESRFGHDFSRVRVHVDAVANQSAHSVNALAYTVGHDVVFGSGQYAPSTAAGQKLIAHELTHVVQQSMTGRIGNVRLGNPYSDAEHEATQVADAIHEPRRRVVSVSTAPILAAAPKPSAKVPDLDEDVVKAAEKAISSKDFQVAINILLKEAASINRVDLRMLDQQTMKFDPQLSQEGKTDDPVLDPTGNPIPSKVTIGPPAFKNVSWLYSTLLHEFVHVQQSQPIKAHMPVTVKGGAGDPSSTNAKEVEAYAFEITNAAATGLKAMPNLISELWGRLCRAYDYLMPVYRRLVESLAKNAFEAAKKIVGPNKLQDCLKNP